MVRAETLKKPTGREERHSAAWGKRLSMMLLLATGMAFGQRSHNPTASNTGRIASELSGLLAKARQGSAKGPPVKVIVQYRQGPTAAHDSPRHGRGGRGQAKRHRIKGAAGTRPGSARPAREAEPE